MVAPATVKPFREKFVRDNPEVEKWLLDKARKSVFTRQVYEHHIYHYFEWLKAKGFTAARPLLDNYRELKKENREYEHIDLAKEYLLTGKLSTRSYKFREQSWRAIRSFYEFNRCPLPREKVDLTISEVDEKRLREKQGLEVMTLEDIKKLMGPAKIRDKAILLILLHSGMRIGEFIDQFNTEEAKSVLNQLREGKCPIKINLIASRRNRPQYFTFIGRDAIDALKDYLNWRRDKMRREIKDEEPLFISQEGNPVDRQVIERQIRVLKRQTGLTNREFTPHTFRDIFKTECSHRGVKDVISEFFIGHALDALGYNQLDKLYPKDFEIEYGKVEPALNVMSFKAPAVIDEKRLAIESAKRVLKAAGLDPDQILRVEIAKRAPHPITTDEQLKILDDQIAQLGILKRPEASKEKKHEQNGGKPFESRIIGEDELTGYLDEGWDLVKELTNGKIVIRRPLES